MCHSHGFLCVGKKRRPENHRRFQHTSRGEQQVRSTNLELNLFFDFNFLSLEKSKTLVDFYTYVELNKDTIVECPRELVAYKAIGVE
jgi:hypothetical protein